MVPIFAMVYQYFNLVTHFKNFQVLPFNTNNFIQHYLFVCTSLNDSNYCYVSLIFQLNISNLFTHG